MRRTKLGYGGGGSGPVAAGSTTVMLMLAACGGVWCGGATFLQNGEATHNDHTSSCSIARVILLIL